MPQDNSDLIAHAASEILEAILVQNHVRVDLDKKLGRYFVGCKVERAVKRTDIMDRNRLSRRQRLALDAVQRARGCFLADR